MKRVKVLITLNIKSDPEDRDQLEQDVREELAGLLESDEQLEFDVADEDEEESEEDF